MALERKDNIGDTTTSTGTGTINLAAVAQTGALIFAGNVTSGATVRYDIRSSDNTEWEIGEGVFTDGSPDTLTRVTVYASSNSGSLVNFSAGTKNVSMVGTVKDHERATGAEINTGTDTDKIVTPKAISDSNVAFIEDIAIANLANPYKARAYLATDQLNLAANFSKVTLDTESYDINNNFDNATNYRYTAPLTGYYAVSASIRFASLTDQQRAGICIYKNGVIWNLTTVNQSGTAITSATFNDILALTATDYLELFVYNDTGGTTVDIEGGVGRTFMAVHLLSV